MCCLQQAKVMHSSLRVFQYVRRFFQRGSCTVVFEFFSTSDVSFSAANSSSLVASYSSRCFSNWACVSWCSSSRLRFSAAAYQNENCVMLMIAFDVKTTASRRLKLRTIQLETTPDHLSCTVVFEFFNTSDVSFSAANSSSLVASYSSRCFSNWACVSWCSSSRLRFSAAAYQNENCVMLMIAFDVKTTASRRLKLRTIQLETTPDHLSCTVVFEFFNTSDVSFSAANSSSLVLRHLCSLLHLLFIHVLFFLLQLLLFLFLGLLLLFNLFGIQEAQHFDYNHCYKGGRKNGLQHVLHVCFFFIVHSNQIKI